VWPPAQGKGPARRERVTRINEAARPAKVLGKR
jgi:hypothetical protein